jgi:hypothetical protein
MTHIRTAIKTLDEAREIATALGISPTLYAPSTEEEVAERLLRVRRLLADPTEYIADYLVEMEAALARRS